MTRPSTQTHLSAQAHPSTLRPIRRLRPTRQNRPILQLRQHQNQRSVIVRSPSPFAARLLDQPQYMPQPVHQTQQPTNKLPIHSNRSIPQRAQQILARMGQLLQPPKTQKTRSPLDRMHRAKDLRHQRTIPRTHLQIGQTPLHPVQPLQALRNKLLCQLIHIPLIGRSPHSISRSCLFSLTHLKPSGAPHLDSEMWECTLSPALAVACSSLRHPKNTVISTGGGALCRRSGETPHFRFCRCLFSLTHHKRPGAPCLDFEPWECTPFPAVAVACRSPPTHPKNYVISTGGGALCRRSGETPAFRFCRCFWDRSRL